MKQIALTQGYCALVDDDDWNWLSAHKWWAAADTHNGIYAKTKLKGKLIAMHTMIMKPPTGFITDHRNLNTLDNQKANLRLATRSQNMANGTRAPSKYGFRGVLKTKYQKGYGAQIRVNGKHIYLGSHPTIEEAARAYDAAALKYFGEFARPNFPNDLRLKKPRAESAA